ncbi:MAG: hypothetical protein HY686_01275 [Chloroflexi bacterium]|nr:hypothetical protein [Chloroflexota bacterium]
MVRKKRYAVAAGLSLVTLFLTILAFACGQPAAAPAPSPTSAEPPASIKATVEALVSQQLTAVAQRTPAPAATPDPARASAADFATAYQGLDKSWQGFHQEYEQWRGGLKGCGEDSLRDALRGLAARFSQDVVGPVNGLERPASVRMAGELLADAAAKDLTALQQLRDSWQPGSDKAFREYEAARVEANALRRQAADALSDALSGVTAETPTSEVTPVPGTPAPARTPAPSTPTPLPARTPGRQSASPEAETFAKAFAGVNATWNSFDKEYDAWRQRNGDCDRAAVQARLSKFAEQFRALAAQVQAMPRPAAVRPLVELLSEAAQKEDRALKVLRDTWQPYDRRHFGAFEQSAREADQLRRQAGAALDDLRVRYGLPK